jgi:hypothetical protein
MTPMLSWLGYVISIRTIYMTRRQAELVRQVIALLPFPKTIKYTRLNQRLQ